jgi:hypothetical protein
LTVTCMVHDVPIFLFFLIIVGSPAVVAGSYCLSLCSVLGGSLALVEGSGGAAYFVTLCSRFSLISGKILRWGAPAVTKGEIRVGGHQMKRMGIFVQMKVSYEARRRWVAAVQDLSPLFNLILIINLLPQILIRNYYLLPPHQLRHPL